MRITGPSRPTTPPSRASAGGAAGRFTVETGAEPGGGTARLGAAAPSAGLEALLALQSVDERGGRRQSLRRGHRILDQLDEVKIALLEGHLPAAALDRLVATLESRTDSGEPSLEAVMDEVELRARVELAKLGRSLD